MRGGEVDREEARGKVKKSAGTKRSLLRHGQSFPQLFQTLSKYTTHPTPCIFGTLFRPKRDLFFDLFRSNKMLWLLLSFVPLVSS